MEMQGKRLATVGDKEPRNRSSSCKCLLPRLQAGSLSGCFASSIRVVGFNSIQFRFKNIKPCSQLHPNLLCPIGRGISQRLPYHCHITVISLSYHRRPKVRMFSAQPNGRAVSVDPEIDAKGARTDSKPFGGTCRTIMLCQCFTPTSTLDHFVALVRSRVSLEKSSLDTVMIWYGYHMVRLSYATVIMYTGERRGKGSRNSPPNQNPSKPSSNHRKQSVACTSFTFGAIATRCCSPHTTRSNLDGNGLAGSTAKAGCSWRQR